MGSAHIVSFDPDSVTVEQLGEAVRDSGGEVVDVLQPLGLALVRSPGPDLAVDAASYDEVIRGSARNQAIATSDPSPGLPEDALPTAEQRRLAEGNAAVDHDAGARSEPGPSGRDRLEAAQWGNELVAATPDQAHQEATGAGVRVAIIDTGIDGSHPDLVENIDVDRSQDFVTGAAGVATDPYGHGTHVAGIIGAARNGLGTAGVAPDATLVNLRAGTQNGSFYLYEVVSAIVAAADEGVDVAVMSFYTQPWLYNCSSRDDYISGSVSEEEIDEQALIRETVLDALAYAHERGVTLVSAAGNTATDLSAPRREDTTSPSWPAGAAGHRVVTNDCLDLPNEGPNVISVSAVGPSGDRAPYSSYGLGSIDVVAPGGWFDDRSGPYGYQRAENLVLSTYPSAAARREGLVDGQGEPTGVMGRRDCAGDACGFYSFQEGTSMAAPFTAGIAALVIERSGNQRGSAGAGSPEVPERVAEILSATAEPRSCEGSDLCEGTEAENSLYGRGVVDAAGAVEAAAVTG